MMPLLERDRFLAALAADLDASARAGVCRKVVDANAAGGVTWVHSYVSPNRTKTFCIYDGPTPVSAVNPSSLPVPHLVGNR